MHVILRSSHLACLLLVLLAQLVRLNFRSVNHICLMMIYYNLFSLEFFKIKLSFWRLTAKSPISLLKHMQLFGSKIHMWDDTQESL